MKKVKLIVLAILACTMFFACTPKNEKLLRNYENACQKGDAIKAMHVISEMEKEFGDANIDEVFTETQQARFETATAVLEQKSTEQMMEQLGGTMQLLDEMDVNPWTDNDDEDEDD